MARRKGTKGDAYEVGYGKPPAHTRFRPGQSGNPKGRMKGSREAAKSLLELFDAIGEEVVETRIGSSVRKMSRRELSIRQFYANLAKGDARAMNMLLAIETKRGKIAPEPPPGQRGGVPRRPPRPALADPGVR